MVVVHKKHICLNTGKFLAFIMRNLQKVSVMPSQFFTYEIDKTCLLHSLFGGHQIFSLVQFDSIQFCSLFTAFDVSRLVKVYYMAFLGESTQSAQRNKHYLTFLIHTVSCIELWMIYRRM